MFFLLFSSTLSVRASGVNNITDIVNFTTPVYQSGDTYVDFKYYYEDEWASSNNSFVWHKDITISPQTNTSNLNLDPYKTYCVYMMTNGSGATATPYLGTNGASGTVDGTSIRYKTINGRQLSELTGSGTYTYRGYALVQGIDLLNGYTNSTNSTCNFLCSVEWRGVMKPGTGILSANPYFAMHLPYNLTIYNLKPGYEYMNTTDMETKRQIQSSENVIDNRLQSSTETIDNTLQEGNEIADDTNETTHGILDSITAFFGSFFNNLIGVFVPEDGFFTTWFNNLNTLLSQKLGVLYYPFEVIIDILTRLNTAFDTTQSNSCIIYFPEMKIRIQGVYYVLLERQEIDLNDYNISIANADTSNSSMFGMTNIIWVMRRFTSISMALMIMKLFIKKLNLILRGSENDN